MASTQRDEIGRLELLHAAHPDGLVFPHLADAYRRTGRYAQAESVLKAGLRRHADYSSAHVVLGRLRLDQGKYEEAERAFLRVLELDPQSHVALTYLGRLSAEQGRLTEALEQFRRLARLKPGADVEERIRELEARVEELRTREATPAASANPGHRTSPELAAMEEPPVLPTLPEPGEVVTETMAELYARQGLTERAGAVYRQLLERDPGNARLQAKLRAVNPHSRAKEDAGIPPAPPRVGNGAVEPEPPQSRAAPSPAPTPMPAPVPASAPGTDSIRDHLSSLLRWGTDEPSPASRAPSETTTAPADSTRHPEYPAREEHMVPTSEPIAKGAAAEAADPEMMAVGSASTARTLIAITDMLVGLLEYRDPFFRGSSSSTRLVGEMVAVELGLSGEERLHLSLAAVLRDLGRLALGGRLVPLSGSAAPETRRRIERHVDLALRLLEGIELPTAVRRAVRHHHERWDGSGYPDRLSGDEIPFLARVLAVVDSFTAMVSPRTYRLPRKVPDAMRELRDAAGTQYDRSVVDALGRVLARQDPATLGVVRRPHVLLVNPDQPGAVVTAAKLCTAGYLAEVSGDAAAARERLRRVPVAALVVSAAVGEEESAAFVRELRVDPLFASLPIVVVDAPSVPLRVRLLESGADVCFPPATSYAELQGTLGALVRRSLSGTGADAGPEDGATGQQAPWLALQGDIRDFPLTWLLQVMKYDSRTAAIAIRAPSAEGVIYLQGGDAVHARVRDGASGESALRQMLTWEGGRFTVQPDARPRERSIRTSIMHLLLTQAVDQDHAAAGIFGAVSDES